MIKSTQNRLPGEETLGDFFRVSTPFFRVVSCDDKANPAKQRCWLGYVVIGSPPISHAIRRSLGCGDLRSPRLLTTNPNWDDPPSTSGYHLPSLKLT